MYLNKLHWVRYGTLIVRFSGTISLGVSFPQAGRETEALSVFQKMFKLNNRHATKPFPVRKSLMFDEF